MILNNYLITFFILSGYYFGLFFAKYLKDELKQFKQLRVIFNFLIILIVFFLLPKTITQLQQNIVIVVLTLLTFFLILITKIQISALLLGVLIGLSSGNLVISSLLFLATLIISFIFYKSKINNKLRTITIVAFSNLITFILFSYAI